MNGASCPECLKKDRTIAGLREAIGRWKAKATGQAPSDPAVVRESYNARGYHRVVRATHYPSTTPAKEAWEAIRREYGAAAERIETWKGVWAVHLVVW